MTLLTRIITIFIPGKEYSDNSDEAIKDCIGETGR
jgi:hypothetical protein